MNVTILKLAETELQEIFDWYENQGIGLGNQFLYSFEQSIKIISTFPEICTEIRSCVRRAIIKRFPFGVLYTFDKTE